MKSMTGFGFGKNESPQSYVEVSIRAINGRFFEPRFHLPREFLPLEADLKRILQKMFGRGTIDVFVSRKPKPAARKSRVLLNHEIARAFDKSLRSLAKEVNCGYEPHVELLVRLPEVLQVETDSEISPKEAKSLMQAMEAACQACERERLREGKSIKCDLERLLVQLKKQLDVISQIRGEVNEQMQARVEQRLKARLKGIELDPQRIAQELGLILEKSDINEEIVRLDEHLQNYQGLMVDGGPLGKKLDFYTQELLREINTIGSKSTVSRLTQVVVEAKTIIERMREQVQNLE
ncbi:MAG: YicC family protein [Bdellovibrio sp.]|nr:MAG: YicC family protein [Bdellovibrio sp.]